MSQFLYLYRSNPATRQETMGTPERAQQNMQRWMPGCRELDTKGHLKDRGQPLERGRQGRARRTEERARRPVHRGEGRHRRLHDRRGEGPRSGGRTVARLSDSRRRRLRGSAARDEDGHVVQWSSSEHLFRRESGRLVAALTRIFGVHNLALAEDVVQDAFCRALEVWKVRGVPENPVRMADDRGEAPRARRRAARADGADVRAGARPRARVGVDARRRDRRGVRALDDPRRAAADDVLVLPSAAARGRRRSRSCSTSCAASARARSRARFSPGAPRWRSGLARGKTCPGPRASACSISPTPTSPRGCRRCGARSICCSARAITARRPRRRCAPSCAARRCGWCSCSSRLRPPPIPRRSRWPR